MKTESATVKLSELSIDPVNVRKTARGGEPKFATSIRRRGILEPMIVRRSQNVGYLIVNGGERFTALQYLKKKGEKANGVPVTDDFGVRVEITDRDDAAARATSLATNLIRAAMHPVDEFEAFAKMIQDGATVEDIATEYAVKAAEVRQALSLAAIHPEIRKAWRDGKIEGEAAEAYAQTKDLAHQLRVFNKLKARAGDEWAVNREIAGDDRHRIDTMLKFVGQKNYEAAGHHVNESLFQDDDRHSITVDNLPALNAMTSAKLEAECARLKADGWDWAILKEDAPNDVYAWRRLHGGTPTKDQKAAAGCTVALSHSGTLEVERGYIKPGVAIKLPKTPAAKKAQAEAAERKKESGGISQGLAWRLSQQITKAAYEALRDDGPLGLRVAIAAMATGDSPASIELKGMGDLNGEARHDNDFAKYFALTAGKGAGELLELLAEWTARSLMMIAHSPDRLPFADKDEPGGAILLNALRPPVFKKAMLAAFDRKDYFGSVSRDLIRSALIDCGGLELASRCSTMKKVGVVAFAIANVAKDWLPPELRTKHYDGPAATAAPKKKAKTTSRKKRQ